jgi:hypothetical protein
MHADIWLLERRFWLEGVSVYEERLHEQALMIFPGLGVMDRKAVIESLRDAPRWDDVIISDERLSLANDSLALAYAAEGRRNDQSPYRVLCGSCYVRSAEGWLMLSHQQTLQT